MSKFPGQGTPLGAPLDTPLGTPLTGINPPAAPTANPTEAIQSVPGTPLGTNQPTNHGANSTPLRTNQPTNRGAAGTPVVTNEPANQAWSPGVMQFNGGFTQENHQGSMVGCQVSNAPMTFNVGRNPAPPPPSSRSNNGSADANAAAKSRFVRVATDPKWAAAFFVPPTIVCWALVIFYGVTKGVADPSFGIATGFFGTFVLAAGSYAIKAIVKAKQGWEAP